jgi:hypothetical protein
MAITHGTTIRGVLAEAIKTGVDQGSTFGKLKILTAADALLATITLQDPAFSRSGAVLTLLGVPLSTTASATGTATKFIISDSDDNVQYQGTCGQSGSDLTIDNASVVSGQTIQITGHTYTAPL